MTAGITPVSGPGAAMPYNSASVGPAGQPMSYASAGPDLGSFLVEVGIPPHQVQQLLASIPPQLQQKWESLLAQGPQGQKQVIMEMQQLAQHASSQAPTGIPQRKGPGWASRLGDWMRHNIGLLLGGGVALGLGGLFLSTRNARKAAKPGRGMRGFGKGMLAIAAIPAIAGLAGLTLGGGDALMDISGEAFEAGAGLLGG